MFSQEDSLRFLSQYDVVSGLPKDFEVVGILTLLDTLIISNK